MRLEEAEDKAYELLEAGYVCSDWTIEVDSFLEWLRENGIKFEEENV